MKIFKYTPRYVGFSLVLFLCAGGSGIVRAAPLSPEAMVKKADLARMPDGSVAFTATVRDKGTQGEVKETRYRVSAKPGADGGNSLVETIFPERLQGRKLLMQGNNLYLYLPSVKKPTRISFRERLTGEVSNGDISRTNYAGDYDPALAGNEKVLGKDCVKLVLTAKHKDVTYPKIHYWLDARTYQPVKADFFALSGKLLKTGEYSAPKQVFGTSRLTRIVIRDALQPARQSTIDYSSFQKRELPDSFFNKENLSE